MKKVIAFSLWGRSAKYWVGAQRNIALAAAHYPGWICRFYVEAGSPDASLAMLAGDNVEIHPVERTNEFGGLFWRFRTAGDPDVDTMLARDCDSRIGLREVAAVKAWLASDKDFHIMRDHPYHTTEVLGGMWGCRNGLLRNIADLMAQSRFPDQLGCDQRFLSAFVYPLVRDRALEHSEFGLAYGGPTVPFPTARIGDEFVGEALDADERRDTDHVRALAAALNPPRQASITIFFNALRLTLRRWRRTVIRRDKPGALS